MKFLLIYKDCKLCHFYVSLSFFKLLIKFRSVFYIIYETLVLSESRFLSRDAWSVNNGQHSVDSQLIAAKYAEIYLISEPIYFVQAVKVLDLGNVFLTFLWSVKMLIITRVALVII